MIVVDFLVQLAQPVQKGIDLGLTWAQYVKKSGGKIEVFQRQNGKINQLVLRELFDSLSDWEQFKQKMDNALKNDPEAKAIFKNYTDNPEMFFDAFERHFWERLDL